MLMVIEMDWMEVLVEELVLDLERGFTELLDMEILQPLILYKDMTVL